MKRPEVSALDVAVDCLAVARIVRLVQVDEMPVGDLREWVLDNHGGHRWAELLRCPHCLSVWVGAFAVLARRQWPRAWPLAARALAGSTAASMVAEWFDRS